MEFTSPKAAISATLPGVTPTIVAKGKQAKGAQIAEIVPAAKAGISGRARAITMIAAMASTIPTAIRSPCQRPSPPKPTMITAPTSAKVEA